VHITGGDLSFICSTNSCRPAAAFGVTCFQMYHSPGMRAERAAGIILTTGVKQLALLKYLLIKRTKLIEFPHQESGLKKSYFTTRRGVCLVRKPHTKIIISFINKYALIKSVSLNI